MKNIICNKKKLLIGFASFFALSIFILSCDENARFEIGSNDNIPPGVPVVRNVVPLYGGARIFYDIPSDEDLLSINAEFTAANGKLFVFSSSYFADSLDVYGLGNMEEHTISLYAVDRSGNKSDIIPLNVVPLEPSITRVARSITVKPGFSSFYVDWENELEQTVNVYVDFKFNQSGVERDIITVFSSNLPEERKFINDLDLPSTEPVNVKIRVEDIYGNITEPIEIGEIYLYEDIKIPKTDWILPLTNDSIAGIPMCFGSGFDGRLYRVIDDEIDLYESSNYMHTASMGRTGSLVDGNVPWNLLIDLGDYYELSRILTHQRHSGGSTGLARGEYYQGGNVGRYNMYYLDEELDEWVFISQNTIDVPVGPERHRKLFKMGDAGDMAYMYPDDPQFTKPTRWFRYEAINSFSSNYTGTGATTLSEVTLYGRKASNP